MDNCGQWYRLCQVFVGIFLDLHRGLQRYLVSLPFYLRHIQFCMSVCQAGCKQCADGTGACISCETGFTQDPNDPTKCNFPQGSTSSGQLCPDGNFSDGTLCNRCSSACKTCSGPTSNDCVLCATGSYLFNGNCVSADENGVCEGLGLIADNIKHECDSA